MGLYILFSSDTIYDVCNKTGEEGMRESDSLRPLDAETKKALRQYFRHGSKKMAVSASFSFTIDQFM